jgi:hypothetical protein
MTLFLFSPHFGSSVVSQKFFRSELNGKIG